MNEIDKTKLSDQTKFRLDEIKKIQNCFNQRKLCSKNLSKYVTTFDYLDKILIVLTTGGLCIVSHATVAGGPVGIASAGFTIVFSLATVACEIMQTPPVIVDKTIKIVSM